MRIDDLKQNIKIHEHPQYSCHFREEKFTTKSNLKNIRGPSMKIRQKTLYPTQTENRITKKIENQEKIFNPLMFLNQFP